MPDAAARTFGSVGRALQHAGPEREAALLVIKSVIATTLAWYLAASVVGADLPTFAAFSALLTVQVSVAQSLDTLVRYSVAVLLGVSLVGVSVLPWGPQLWIFASVVLVAVGVGRWRPLGSYGIQVAVVTVFAYGTFATSASADAGLSRLAGLVGMVVLGTVVGVATSLVVAPPLRYRGAEHTVRALAHADAGLLTDMAAGIADGVPTQEQTGEWRQRADQLPGVARQARHTIEHAAEVSRFNPRRLGMRGHSSFGGYRVIVNTIDRVNTQVIAVAKGLDRASHREDGAGSAHGRFLDDYRRLLDTVAEAINHLGQLHTTHDLLHDERFPQLVDQSTEAHQHLVDNSAGVELDQPSQWAIYGGLHIDAERLVDELVSARDELARYARSLRTSDRRFLSTRHLSAIRPRARSRRHDPPPSPHSPRHNPHDE